MQKRYLFLAAVPLVAALHGCATAEPIKPRTVRSVEEMSTLVGDAACEDSSQCRTIAVGAKPCGGPESYLAWSTLRTDEQRLNEAVQRHTALQQADNRANQRSSTCMMTTNPGAACVAKRCTLNPQGGDLPSRRD